MRIKGADGHEYNVASQGVGGAGLGLGIAGTVLGLLNGGGNILPFLISQTREIHLFTTRTFFSNRSNQILIP
jgi:hypothetical protein